MQVCRRDHYYYTLFPYQGEPPAYAFDYHNRCVAMATSAYGFGGRMFELLPRIYHRYDTAAPTDPASLPAELVQAGQLRRFLEVPGSMLDLLYSHAGAALDLHHTASIDGRLLPLLAQWIAWQIDFRLEIDAQRNEISNAPHLYKTVGLIPTVEATVKRLTNWESRIKELSTTSFSAITRKCSTCGPCALMSKGNGSRQESPLSLNFAYEGRPATATGESGVIWLLIIPAKRPLGYLAQNLVGYDGWSPSSSLTEGPPLTASRRRPPRQASCGFSGMPMTRAERHLAHPVPALQRRRVGLTPRPWPGYSQRKSPPATVDGNGGLWLFWLELEDGRWQMKYGPP